MAFESPHIGPRRLPQAVLDAGPTIERTTLLSGFPRWHIRI